MRLSIVIPALNEAKILDTESGSAQIIGVQIGGLHAGELIGTAVLAVNKHMKLSDLATSIFAHPTLSEIHKKSAGKYYAQKIFSSRVKHISKFIFGYQGSVEVNLAPPRCGNNRAFLRSSFYVLCS